jgi:ferredoxin
VADKTSKWPNNVVGRFFVDQSCIDCDACRSEAPSHFTRDDEHGYSYVYRQPKTPEEEAACRAAMEACPVEAIGKDEVEGEEHGGKEASNDNVGKQHPS